MLARLPYTIFAFTAVANAGLFWWVADYPVIHYARTSQLTPEVMEASFSEETQILTSSTEPDKIIEKRFTVPTQIATAGPALVSPPTPPALPALAPHSNTTLPSLVSPLDETVTSPPLGLVQLKVTGRRVVYLVDASGSMRRSSGAGTRLDGARQAVMQSLLNLPNDTQFNVLYFATQTESFRPQLSYANAATKREATRFLQEEPNLERNETDLLAALRTALQMQPDAVWVVTDGDTQGFSWNILLQTRRCRKNFAPEATISVVGVQVGADDEDLLRKLSVQNDGAYQSYPSFQSVQSAKR